MSLLGSIAGFFICKALLMLPFYFRQWERLLTVTLFTSLAIVPLATILYHETRLDFWFVYAGMIVLDIFICYFLLQQNGWKAVPAALISNTIAIIFFFIVNG